jgi:hypothetical protein
MNCQSLNRWRPKQNMTNTIYECSNNSIVSCRLWSSTNSNDRVQDRNGPSTERLRQQWLEKV